MRSNRSSSKRGPHSPEGSIWAGAAALSINPSSSAIAVPAAPLLPSMLRMHSPYVAVHDVVRACRGLYYHRFTPRRDLRRDGPPRGGPRDHGIPCKGVVIVTPRKWLRDALHWRPESGGRGSAQDPLIAVLIQRF